MINDSKIFDCFTFFNEQKLLNIRFNVLNKFVDYFVICESKYDHRGEKKKLNFNVNDYSKFKDKIIYIVLDNFPNFKSPWDRQDFQRDYLLNGISKAKPDDILLFSDVDEIPNLENNIDLIFKNPDKVGIFNQNVFYYKLNLKVVDYDQWEGTRVIKKKNLKTFSWLRNKTRLKNLRYRFWRIDKYKKIYKISNGGWHFSFLGDPEMISSKIKSYTHSEYDKNDFTSIDQIRKRISELKDPYDRDKKLIRVKIDKSYPDHIINNQEYYKKLISEL